MRVMSEEEHPTREESIPPLPGRAFHLRLQPAARLTWVGAGWAAICGAIAAGPLHLSADTAVRVLLILVLVDPVLGAVWTTLSRIQEPSRRGWAGPDDPAIASVAEAGLLVGLALLLGLALGPGVAVVVALGLLFPLVVWFALGGYPLRDGWTRAVLEIGLPWTIGLAAFAGLPASDPGGLAGLTLSAVAWAGEHAAALAIGLLFVVAYYGKLTLDQPLRRITRRALVTLPQVVVVALLVVWHRPVLAAAVAILVLAQMLFQPYLDRHHIRWYLRTTQWLFMGVMLLTAVGVAPWGQ